MQANEITIQSDIANDENLVSKTYRRTRYANTQSLYQGPSHTVASRNQLQFYVTDAKRSGESRGIQKCALKLTRDMSVENASGSGDIILPEIGSINFSLPVGVTAAETKELRQDLIAILDDDEIMGRLMNDGES